MIYLTHDGVQYRIHSDNINDFHRNLPAMRGDISNMRAIHAGEQKWFHRKDQWDIKEVFGQTTVDVYGGRVVKKKKRKLKLEASVDIEKPLLAVRMSTYPVWWSTSYQGDMFQDNVVPVDGGANIFIDKDADKVRTLYEFERLTLVSHIYGWWDITVGNNNATVHYEYPDWEDDHILLDDDFAYRNLHCDGHTWYGVVPILFTCDDYIQVSSCDTIELWSTYESNHLRAIVWQETDSRSILIGSQTVLTSASVMEYPIDEYYKVDDYEFTNTQLLADGFSQDEIDDHCIPFGDYEIWHREWASGQFTGTDVFLEWAAETTGESGSFYQYEWVAFLYSYYIYSSMQDYHYELRLWIGHIDEDTGEYVNDDDVKLYQGDSGPFDQPDDLYVNYVRLYEFKGKPVAVWGYQYFDYNASDGYFVYGIWYNGQMNQIEPSRFWYTDMYAHDLFGSAEDFGLYAYGDVSAMSVKKTYESLPVEAEIEE